MITTLAYADIATIAVVGGLSLGALGIVFGTIGTIVDRWQRERSRREVAAYIAEGSMTPEEGERLLNADNPSKCRSRRS